MPQFLLIRHASVDGLGERIHGRSPAIGLNEQGKRDAAALAQRLAHAKILAIVSSPRERAHETAQALSRHLGLQVAIDDDLDEIDYGEWTGRRFSDLEGSPDWQRFNRSRESASIPNGETMQQTMQRATRAVERIGKLHPTGRIAFITHADWIRTLVSNCLGVPFSSVLMFPLPTASVVLFEQERAGSHVVVWNRGELPSTTSQARHAS